MSINTTPPRGLSQDLINYVVAQRRENKSFHDTFKDKPKYLYEFFKCASQESEEWRASHRALIVTLITEINLSIFEGKFSPEKSDEISNIADRIFKIKQDESSGTSSTNDEDLSSVTISDTNLPHIFKTANDRKLKPVMDRCLDYIYNKHGIAITVDENSFFTVKIFNTVDINALDTSLNLLPEEKTRLKFEIDERQPIDELEVFFTHFKKQIVDLQIKNIEVPNCLGILTNLKKLSITCCASLEELPDSLGTLSKLEIVSLTDCPTLKQLPDSLCKLSNLKTLRLTACQSLEKLPDSLCNLSNLITLGLTACQSLEKLPDSLGTLSNLEIIEVGGCFNLKQLPPSIGNLSNLMFIIAIGCASLEELPDSLGKLLKLERIDLRGCVNLKSIPSSLLDRSIPGELPITYYQACERSFRTCAQPLINFLETKQGQKFMSDNIVIIHEHCPDISSFIITKYPVDQPQNSKLYPLIIQVDKTDILSIKCTLCHPDEKAFEVLKELATQIRWRKNGLVNKIRVSYFGHTGVDEGGLRRDFFSRLIAEISNKMNFQKQIPPWSTEIEEVLQDIGLVLNFINTFNYRCLNTVNDNSEKYYAPVPTGEVFHPDVFKRMLKFNEKEIGKDFSQISNDRLFDILLNSPDTLTSLDGTSADDEQRKISNAYTAQVKSFWEWKGTGSEEEIDQHVKFVHFAEDVMGLEFPANTFSIDGKFNVEQLQTVKNAIRNDYVESRKPLLHTIHSLIQGMVKPDFCLMPLHAIVKRGSEALQLNVQGKFNREELLKAFEWKDGLPEGVPSLIIDCVKGKSDEELKHFLNYISGAPVIPVKKIQVFPLESIQDVGVSSCFNAIYIPKIIHKMDKFKVNLVKRLDDFCKPKVNEFQEWHFNAPAPDEDDEMEFESLD